MKNIAIFLYDYSLLGGVQKVTSNIVNAFYEANMPIKCIITCHDSGEMSYPYPKEVRIYNIQNRLTEITEILKKEQIGNLILQVEKPTLCNKVINVSKARCSNIFPVLHSSPRYWIRKYFSVTDYLTHPRYVLQLIKMVLYWRPVHKRIFKDWAAELGIVCVSLSAVQELREIVKKKKPDNINYIYNINEIRDCRVSQEKQNLVIFAGRLSTEKRPLLMLKVWRNIYKKYTDWKLDILGDGPMSDQMRRYIQSHHIENVELKGKVNNVEDYLQKSKITLLFSKYEGLPTVLLEAASKNNSILACESDGGTKDIVHDRLNGFICPPKPKELTMKLQALMLNDGELALAMGRRNMQFTNQFSNTQIINRWKEILK